MEEFSFKQAPLRGVATYTCEGTILTKYDAGRRVDWTLDLREVSQAHFVGVLTKIGFSRELFLHSAAGLHKVYYVLPKGSRDDDVFCRLLRTIGDALDVAQPGFVITMGMRGASGAVMFAAAVLAIMTAVGLSVAMVVNGVDDDAVLAVAAPLLGLVAFGAWGARMYWPWRKLPQIPAAAFSRR